MKEILIKLRQENRYSQSLLSKVLGISRQAYMKYESGEVEPSVEIVRKLSKIYKVPYDVLIDNKVQKESKKVLYGFPEEKSLNVASPSISYGTSNSYNCGANLFDGGGIGGMEAARVCAMRGHVLSPAFSASDANFLSRSAFPVMKVTFIIERQSFLTGAM